jgi:hypothetical protein
MSTFIERLKVEKTDLAEKTEKLISFIDNEELFSKIDPMQQTLLKQQVGYMQGYLSVLEQRLDLLN